MQTLAQWAVFIIDGLGIFLFVVLLGLAISFAVMYIQDCFQHQHAVRRNFPLIGRVRYGIESLGPFLRQYLFDTDRGLLPFNRAERAWVYRAAKNLDNTVAFGSTLNLTEPGTVIFANSAFPILDQLGENAPKLVIGPHTPNPYTPQSFFNISGMSFGALSKPAVQALARGAAKAGCWMDTGEGGLAPYHLEGGCDIVMQIGTAKYGVRDLEGKLSDAALRQIAAYPQVKMFELKLSQGAKPGKGGILPAIKVTAEIAKIRGIHAGQDSISPNRHPEIKNTDDLLDMIEHIRAVTGKPTGIKLALGEPEWIDELCEKINQRGSNFAPDFITLDSGDGGSGAAPETLIDNVGLLLRESLPVLVDKLTEHGLRERVRVIAAGKLLNPVSVAWALCMGADFINSARGFLFALGCIQAMQCNKNTCPTGITTQDPRLQRGLNVELKAERVYHFAKNMVKEVEVVAHSCGVSDPRQLRRHHVRMVTEGGRSVRLDQLFPPATPKAEPLRVVDGSQASLSPS
ncbi:MAG TPA: FMN-binding glutamate synthase family protein [Spongiibacteraceae bacterium]